MTTKENIRKTVHILRSGKVAAFPTDTVFGIGALLSSPKAIARIYKLKKRPRSKPLQILVGSLKQAQELGVFNAQALRLANKNWPGPLTIVMPKTRAVPKIVTGGLPTVGLRMPAHRTALDLIRKCGPIAATSANTSGEAPALTAKEVKQKLPQLDYVLTGRVRSGKPSRVIDVTRGSKTLRP